MFDQDSSDDEMDALLRTALSDRPEPGGGGSSPDLAARVLATARPRAEVRALLPAVPAWPTWAAAVATAAVVIVGVVRLVALGDTSAPSDTTVAATAASDTVALLPAGGIGLMMMLAWLTARSAFAAPEPLAA